MYFLPAFGGLGDACWRSPASAPRPPARGRAGACYAGWRRSPLPRGGRALAFPWRSSPTTRATARPSWPDWPPGDGTRATPTPRSPRVSFVIPTLNSEHYLAGCLDAVRAQDYPEDLVEIVIADGGSTDRTREIAEGYGARVVDNPGRTGEAGKAAGIAAAPTRSSASSTPTTRSSGPTGCGG